MLNPHRKPPAPLVLAVAYCLLAVACWLLCAGCGGKARQKAVTPPQKVSAPESARQTVYHLEAAKVEAAKTTDAVETITPENLPETKPLAVAQSKATAAKIDEGLATAKATTEKVVEREKVIVQLVKENDDLRKDDPTRKWLRVASGVCLFAGVVCGAFMFKLRSLNFMVWSGILLFTGGGLYTVAEFLPTVKLVMAGLFSVFFVALLTGFGYLAWALLKRKTQLARVVESVDVARRTGMVMFNTGADQLLDLVQGPEGKAAVDEVQGKKKGGKR